MSFLWGNTANQQQDKRKFANISDDQINSNQQAVPVKYLAGRNYIAGDFITPAYNPKAVPIKSETGKSQGSTTGYKYFADFALMFCTGGRRPVDAVYTVIVDSDIRWSGNVTRTNHDYETIQVDDGKLGTIHIYWGSDSQQIDAKLLRVRAATASNHQDKTTFNANHQAGRTQFGGFDAGDSDPFSGHYDQHPAYRGQCYAVFVGWKLGRDRTSVPNIQLEVSRGCPAPWLAGGGTPMPPGDDPAGVNPIAILYDWLTDTRFGMALPDSMLNLTNTVGGFAAAYAALEAVGARISPLITEQTDFRQVIADLLGYYDGWIRRNGTKIEVGVWAKGNIPHGAILSDDDLLAEPELEPQGFATTINELTVAYKDKDHHFNDYVQVYRDPNNFRITGGPRPETLSRPWITDADLAKAFVRTSGAAMALPFTKGDLIVRREWVTDNALLPGMVFTYNSVFYGPTTGVGLSFLMRLLEIEYAADKDASAKLTVEWERSKWPNLYTPQAFQGPGGFVIGPRAIWQSRITEVPYLLLDQKFDTQLIVLATRGNVEVQGYRIWVSLDAGATYNLVPDDASTSSFASFGRLAADIGDTVQFAPIYLHGIDLDEVVSQSAAEQQDDTLLLFIDGEVMSVQHVNPFGGGKFNVQILRGRFGTTKAQHLVGAGKSVFFLYRANLKLLDNAGFIPGAAVLFKLQPFTADTDFDITTITPISYTVVGFADIAAPVLSPAPGTFSSPPATLAVSVSTPLSGFKARVTTNGSPVTGSSPEWAHAGTPPHYIPINISGTTTFRVRFFHTDSGRSSDETVGTYTKVTTLPPGNQQQCAAPQWVYTGVLKHSPGNLILTAVTPGSIIHAIKTHQGTPTIITPSGGPMTIAILVNQNDGDYVEFWATLTGYNDSVHTTIDNTRETTYGGGGHWPPRNPP